MLVAGQALSSPLWCTGKLPASGHGLDELCFPGRQQLLPGPGQQPAGDVVDVLQQHIGIDGVAAELTADQAEDLIGQVDGVVATAWAPKHRSSPSTLDPD